MSLSVALCTYNGAQYIEEQLLSILDQELPVNEIVVCDDGSKDETVAKVQQIADKYPNVKWVIRQNSQNLGVTQNFEKAIQLCTGDIIFLSDQDDVWHKNKTKVINEYFEANSEKNVVFTDAILIGGDGCCLFNKSLFDVWGLKKCMDFWNNGMDFDILNYTNVATGATMALKKSACNKFLPFIRNIGVILHDWQIVMNASLSRTLGIISIPLMDYRIHEGNTIGLGEKAENLSESKSSILYPFFIYPKGLNAYFRKHHNDRIEFYIKRQFHIARRGKISLLLSIRQYRLIYGHFWKLVFISDLLYGISNKMRNRYLSSYFKAFVIPNRCN